MRLGLSAAARWRALLCTATLLCGASNVAAKDAPGIVSTKFEHSPYDLRYFDDSDVVLMQDYVEDAIYRSPDAGVSWAKIANIPDGEATDLVTHPFDNTRAYVLTDSSTHYRTRDRGESWEQFETGFPPDLFADQPLRFHAGDEDKIIFNAQDCLMGLYCAQFSLYTLDDFKTPPNVLRDDTSGCQWAKGTKQFAERQTDLEDNRILCITKGQFSPWKKDYKLKVSDNFFQDEFEPALEGGRTVAGVAKIAAVKGYIVTASVADKTDEMAMFVTYDTIKWHRAMFPHDHKLMEEAYTILESTDYSIQIDVMSTRPDNPMGVLLSSNSNGTYFTRNAEHTNRNSRGNVDFEQVAGIQGIVLVNVVDNWKAVEEDIFAEKEIKSQISFDDGRTWQGLEVDGEELHIHSVTEASNSGRIFSSLAPGLLMGVGNTGKHLGDYEKSNLYMSDDAGVTWSLALLGPHKYEFGDSGSILVAIEDAVTDKVSYSLDHGHHWKEVDLPEMISPYVLTTTLDSTSLKFILVGTSMPEDIEEYYIMSLDFEEMHERKCGKKDLEKWYARVDKKGEPSCLMGHRQYFHRRKPKANCFMKQEFTDPTPEFEKCECSDIDYECDFNFVRSEDGKECVQQGSPLVPEGACKAPDDTYLGTSGWRLIPGNECTPPKSGGKDKPISRPCSGVVAPPASGNVNHTAQQLPGRQIYEYLYFERTETSTGDDETVIAQTDKGVFLSHDHGKNWEAILTDVKVDSIVRQKYMNDRVFFIAKNGHVYYSVDRGDNIQKFNTKVPHPHNWALASPMSFHPTKKDWIIWTGQSCSKKGDDCHAVASISLDRGDSWKTLARYVRKCDFIYEEQTAKQQGGEKLIFCQMRTRESPDLIDNPWKLEASTDFFDESVTHFDDVVDFATMSEYIIVAVKDEENNLAAQASIDGMTFAEALFPYNFHVPHQYGYTVLDSSTHAVFLHATVNTMDGQEYGGIVKSNSNGTSYVLSLNGVNRDSVGYVDFEKAATLEGVALANVVSNYNTLPKDKKKNIRTMITHNDGAEWRYLTPPAADVDGEKFPCSSSNLVSCSLNVHGYTERVYKSHTYAPSSGVGLMLAVGNVGDSLLPFDKSDTYLTSDAGITWRQVKKGNYMWAYGDQGSIIVLVRGDGEPTNVLHYSRDEGVTWEAYLFSEPKVSIKDITTLPSDNSRNFLLWTQEEGAPTAINVDFSGLTDRECVLDETHDNDDYYLWTPRHPTQDTDCVFGHTAQYHRKRPEADCFNGRRVEALHSVASNCSCTRSDYECDYNYEAQPGGECLLVPGLEPADHAQACFEDPELVEYFEPTGYRKIPLSTCEGGKEMDRIKAKPCPGRERDYERRHGLGAGWIVLIVLLSVGAAAAVGWVVFRRFEGRFGAIRLGEQTGLDDQAPYVKYPVLAIAAIGAVVIATPAVVGSVWGWVRSMFQRDRRYTTRSSFARGPEYAAVDEDEGELLGEESDEDV